MWCGCFCERLDCIMDYGDGERENSVYLQSLPAGAWEGSSGGGLSSQTLLATTGILYMCGKQHCHAIHDGSSMFTLKQKFPHRRDERARGRFSLYFTRVVQRKRKQPM